MQFASHQPDQDNAEDFADDLNLTPPAEEKPVEGDWNDEDDEDFDDQMEFEEDLREIRTGDDLGEPDPEDDDHLPDEELQ
ncbi:hypothetical protein [Mucilaginibacter phyllosphaerae]|uniref:Uncharacterized protein n=1 Tax=Mucilaginibacter phyllosphaerae TaxID=1812349 RepID=A0A4Y8ALG7_9SPHI|nr:hypothetical protein [Mucilaginibacter phyllosphaerae]MBB3967664.1 hypothetical protein [Mucilaginibacter phyllosphaerae]TEW69281.1 hypothetical protein E2R65_03700 [Mucilaginibacter phyllosphaerae]